MPQREPYQGQSRKLVIAFDIGKTHSGVSYCMLDPGTVPVIQGVSRYPGQDREGGDSRIPSILYYDHEGKARAIGAEALQESVIEEAEAEDWQKVEWWKLHLRPRNTTPSEVIDEDLPPLPIGKTAVEILCDFMQYLFECTRNYIQKGHVDGPGLWASLKDEIDFVFSHPNSWEGPQQAQIRRAAVLAGLIGDKPEEQSRIRLVTEGKAIVHLFLSPSLSAAAFHENQGVIIVDAGEVTIEVSAFHVADKLAPVEEVAPTIRCLQGSIFVTRRVELFLREKLKGSKFGEDADINGMTKVFNNHTMLIFRNPSEASYIKFGTMKDKDPAFNIRSGGLKVPGTEIAKLFEPSIKAIIEAVDNQRRCARKPINSVFLVGSFSANDWVFHSLKESLTPHGLDLTRPDSYTSGRVVANGAVAFYLDHDVPVRMACFTYGTRCAVEYKKDDPEHVVRAGTFIRRPSGRSVLPNVFNPILVKGMQISEDKEFCKEFIIESTSKSTFDKISTDIFCYQGDDPAPRWIDSEPDNYTNLCTVYADTSQVAKTAIPRKDASGLQFYRQEFSLVLIFGLMELKAQISWMEDGIGHRGPASVVYDHVIEEQSPQW